MDLGEICLIASSVTLSLGVLSLEMSWEVEIFLRGPIPPRCTYPLLHLGLGAL